MNKKTWTIFIAIVILVIGGMVYLSKANRLDVSDVSEEAMSRIIAGEERNGNIADHTQGNKDAAVVLVEYADYQCPGCASSAPTVKKLAEQYSDSMLLVFRNYPITTMHPNARVAAAAVEAAGLQGKFWEMHDLVFSNQDSWKDAGVNERTAVFLSYGEEIGLDRQQLEKDLTSEAVKKKIDFDVAIGRRQHVTGTPSFFLNGKEVPMSEVEAKTKAALQAAGVKVQ